MGDVVRHAICALRGGGGGGGEGHIALPARESGRYGSLLVPTLRDLETRQGMKRKKFFLLKKKRSFFCSKNEKKDAVVLVAVGRVSFGAELCFCARAPSSFSAYSHDVCSSRTISSPSRSSSSRPGTRSQITTRKQLDTSCGTHTSHTVAGARSTTRRRPASLR